MLKKLDLLLSIAGILFLTLLGIDFWKSDSIVPEGLTYTIFRSPETYPSAVEKDIEQIQLEISEAIREEIENNRTGCISFRGLPNAICLGTKQSE